MLSPFSALAFSESADGTLSATVCFRAGGESTRFAAAERVEGLRRELAAVGSGRWLVYHEDAFAAAVSMLALAESGCTAVMAPNAQPETLRRLTEGVRGALLPPGVILGVPDLPVLAPLGASSEPPFERRDLDPNGCVAELQTTGTTGAGKSVSKELRHLADEVAVLEHCFGKTLGEGVSVFATVSPQHIYGLLFRVLWPLASGRPFQADTLLLPPELFPRMQARVPSALVTTPSHLAHMTLRPEFAALRGGCRAVFTSGAPLPATLRDAVEQQLGAPPIEILGSTETGGIAWRQGEEDWRAFPGVEIERGETGRLAVTSTRVSTGEPCGGGRRRFETGDLCELRSPGRFALGGRVDRVVKIAGKRLELRAMEQELAAHDSVAECALLALARGREARVHAVVVPSNSGRRALADDGQAALRESLQEHLAARFDRVLLPRGWRFVAELPRDAQGKLPLAALRALFARATEPELLREVREGDALVQALRVPSDLAHFDGHFPGRPVVPGVVALSWAMAAARRLIGEAAVVQCVDVVKFPTPLLPGQQCELRVEHLADKGRIRFELREADTVFASGRCTLALEASA